MYFFEVVVYLRRIIFILIQQYFLLARISNDFSIKNASFILLVFIFLFNNLYHYLRPYKDLYFKNIHLIETFSQRVLFITVFIASLWVSQIDEISFNMSLFFTIFILTINGSFLIRWLGLKLKKDSNDSIKKDKSTLFKKIKSKFEKLFSKKVFQKSHSHPDFTTDTTEILEQKIHQLEQTLVTAKLRIKVLENVNSIIADTLNLRSGEKKYSGKKENVNTKNVTNTSEIHETLLTETPLINLSKKENLTHLPLNLDMESENKYFPLVLKNIRKNLHGRKFKDYVLNLIATLSNTGDSSIHQIRIGSLNGNFDLKFF
jgi:hypothetical protein